MNHNTQPIQPGCHQSVISGHQFPNPNRRLSISQPQICQQCNIPYRMLADNNGSHLGYCEQCSHQILLRPAPSALQTISPQVSLPPQMTQMVPPQMQPRPMQLAPTQPPPLQPTQMQPLPMQPPQMLSSQMRSPQVQGPPVSFGQGPQTVDKAISVPAQPHVTRYDLLARLSTAVRTGTVPSDWSNNAGSYIYLFHTTAVAQSKAEKELVTERTTAEQLRNELNRGLGAREA